MKAKRPFWVRVKGFVRWAVCTLSAAFLLIVAWREIMTEVFAWTNWRPWVGWFVTWIACDIYAKRYPSNDKVEFQEGSEAE